MFDYFVVSFTFAHVGKVPPMTFRATSAQHAEELAMAEWARYYDRIKLEVVEVTSKLI